MDITPTRRLESDPTRPAGTVTVRRRRNRAARTAIGVFAIAIATGATISGGGFIEVLDADTDRYRDLAMRGPGRELPDATRRLVVVREGVTVVDRGLVERRSIDDAPIEDGRRGRVLEERGVVDRAWVDASSTAALLTRSQYRVARNVDTNDRFDPADDRTLERRSSVLWIDVEHPDGRWEVSLPNGHLAEEAFVANHGRGAAMLSTDEITAEFFAWAADGRVIARLSDLLPSSTTIRAVEHGGFFAADVSYPSRPDLPDRGVLVVDLLQRTHWVYHWRYGSDQEPVAWEIQPTGELHVTTADRIYVYDRTGTPVSSSKARFGRANKRR